MSNIVQPVFLSNPLPETLRPVLVDFGRALIANGYEIIPLKPGEKRPIGNDWQARSISVERIKEARAEFGAINIGCRTGKVVAVDIDVWAGHPRFRELLAAIEGVLGITPLVRWGRKGCVLLYRAAGEPMKKRKIDLGTFDYHGAPKKVGDEQRIRDRRQAIEVLGLGQQVVLYGVHP